MKEIQEVRESPKGTIDMFAAQGVLKSLVRIVLLNQWEEQRLTEAEIRRVNALICGYLKYAKELDDIAREACRRWREDDEVVDAKST